METITEETKTDWMKDLEVITENTRDRWSGRMGVYGNMGGIEDFLEIQVEGIRNVVKEKNGSVSDEVNEVLDRYEMEQTETNRKLEDLYGSWIDIQSYEEDIKKRIVEVKNKIVELLDWKKDLEIKSTTWEDGENGYFSTIFLNKVRNEIEKTKKILESNDCEVDEITKNQMITLEDNLRGYCEDIDDWYCDMEEKRNEIDNDIQTFNNFLYEKFRK